MYKIQQIITKNGDKGFTDLPGYDNKISKGSIIFECIGAIDEANSYIGMARELSKDHLLQYDDALDEIQNNLFHLGADVIRMTYRIKQNDILSLEVLSKEINDTLPALNSFVIPQGISAPMHVARANVRRAERKYWLLCSSEEYCAQNDTKSDAAEMTVEHDVDENGNSDTAEHLPGIYLNRLSDLLFILGRYVHHQTTHQERTWQYERTHMTI